MKRVVVGISGGVDSSVAAVLLQKQGYEVVGVTFKFIDNFDDTDAKVVCDKLNIEHHTIDYRDIFKEKVIDRFINDYNEGITPNPCFICNRFVKFNFLYDAMKEFNCDYFATGHYAKIENGKLYKSVDLNKDQTYFISNVKKEQLNHVLFPLEGIDKAKVREIALENGLINASKKDSTDVCFINDNFRSYMDENIKNIAGDVVDVESLEVIGKHDGLNKYTIGQRKGLNIGGNKDRIFVVGKDLEKNILYIASGDNNDFLLTDSALIENVNWISDKKVDSCMAKFRYRQQENEVKLEFLDDNKLRVYYPQKIKSVTPGQAAVFYLDNECLGGGVIKEVYKDNKKVWYL